MNRRSVIYRSRMNDGDRSRDMSYSLRPTRVTYHESLITAITVEKPVAAAFHEDGDMFGWVFVDDCDRSARDAT